MFIRKHLLDLETGAHTPIPTQIVGNGEYLPAPQTPEQRQVQARINALADIHGRRLGLSRRQFLRTSGGMAAAFMAMNDVFGRFFDVHAAELTEPAAHAEIWPKHPFIFDVQTHHVRSGPGEQKGPLAMRRMAGTINAALAGKTPTILDLMLPNFTKEVFFDSDVSVACLSGVPSKLLDAINADEMAAHRDALNALAGSERMLCHGLWAPYMPLGLDEADRQVERNHIRAWKFYTGVFDREGEFPWWLDDEKLAYPFYERSRKLGVTTVCVHKGLPLPDSRIEYTHPRDVKRAALDHPDFTFVIYHSGFKAANWDLPPGDGYVGPDGYLAWTTDLCRDRRANPGMTNVYMELGTTLGHTIISHPNVCAHLLGQVIQAFGVDHVLFGTDSIWWGSPQWQIEALRRFQIPEVLQEKYGYARLSDDDKTRILGLNAARVFGVDVSAARKAFPADGLTRLKAEYHAEGGQPSNTQYGWVRKA
jgi:predicted TIM-barrel fold metal-dependent hydrolase